MVSVFLLCLRGNTENVMMERYHGGHFLCGRVEMFIMWILERKQLDSCPFCLRYGKINFKWAG